MMKFFIILLLLVNIYHLLSKRPIHHIKRHYFHSIRQWWNKNIQEYLHIKEFGYKIDDGLIDEHFEQYEQYEQYEQEKDNTTYLFPFIEFDINRIIFLFM